MQSEEIVKFLKTKKIIFWDFDGVIKDSVFVKARAFEKLFKFADQSIIEQIRQHHLNFGGVSRFEKLKIYLEWAGINPLPSHVEEYALKFSEIVFNEVVNSEWVPGVLEYLKDNYENQIFVLVTATPQKEIEAILTSIGITTFFRKIYGDPVKKHSAMAEALSDFNVELEKSVMIGDSESDYEAAIKAKVQFILRTAPYNSALAKKFDGIKFGNLK